MKDDWKKLIYEDVDFDGEISDYDILENDDNLRLEMEREEVPSSDYEEDDGCLDEDEIDGEDYFDEEFYEETDDGYWGNREEISIPLTFVEDEPKKTKPRTGVWKYYDAMDNSWDFVQALIDYFPEVAQNYKCDNTHLAKIVADTYAISPKKAIEYLNWLWEFFPSSILNQREKEFDNPSYQCRAYLVWYLITQEEETPELYNFVCSDKVIENIFIESIFEKNETVTIKSFLTYFIGKRNFDVAIKAYNSYKNGQEGNYSEQDLADLWDDIFVISLDEVSVPKKIYDFLNMEINSLMPYSKRAVKNFARVRLE